VPKNGRFLAVFSDTRKYKNTASWKLQVTHRVSTFLSGRIISIIDTQAGIFCYGAGARMKPSFVLIYIYNNTNNT